MKKLIILVPLLLALIVSNGQELKKLDSSPLDFAVFRPNGQDTYPIARIIYSRPQKKGREIFGALVPYDKVWRTGANQSTEINIYEKLTINGKELNPGSYTLYTIPREKEWTIIFNSKLFTWGAFDYEESKNVLEVKVPSNKSNKVREHFGIAFAGENGKGVVLLAWDDVEIRMDFNY